MQLRKDRLWGLQTFFLKNNDLGKPLNKMGKGVKYCVPGITVTVRDAAKQLELTEYRMRQLIREKQILATKIGQWRIMPVDIEEFIPKKDEQVVL